MVKLNLNVRKLLVFHYLRMYLKILRSTLKTFGVGLWFFYYFFKIPAILIYIHLSMFLDNIFFPRYRRVKIEKPVFIVGHPRSATTFLHKILTQTEEYATFKHWELNNPSLTVRKLLRHSTKLQMLFSLAFDLRFSHYRLIRAIRNARKKKADEARGKEISRAVETHKEELEAIAQEEEFLFQLILDSQFLSIVTPLGFVKEGYRELCFNDDQPHQEKSVRFLENCFKRQIYYTGNKQVVAKMNFSLFRIKTLLKRFPDAKFIYMVRSPVETIQSHFSLHRELLDRFFGLNNIGEERLKQYFEHRYRNNLLFYRHYENLINNNEIPSDKIMEITYPSIRNDLAGVLQQFRDFTGIRFSPELEQKLKDQAGNQSSYKRPHENLRLETFNLTEEKIRSDFDFVYKRHELDSPQLSNRASCRLHS
ncbi:MAG TPA: sulfotransferase [Candidatus Hodarchaeales archaeon]|nr:sulfotransferase [Candidatus Hodarchaeales archaeon]